MKSLAIVINARLESTRCPNKHIRPLGDTTLIDLCLGKVDGLANVEEKYLAAYEPELINMLCGYNTIAHLPRKYEAVKKGQVAYSIAFAHYKDVRADYIMTVNPCQPFVKRGVYQDAINWFKNGSYDGCLSAIKERNFFFFEDGHAANFKRGDKLSSINGPAMLRCSHTFFIFRKDYFVKTGEIWSNSFGDPEPFVIPSEGLFDVDTEEDFKVAVGIYEKLLEEKHHAD